MSETVLETKRLVLRNYTMDDFAALYEIMSDAETMQHYPAPFDADRTRNWISWNLDNYKKYGFGVWAVVLKETGEFIGDCGLTMQNIDGEMLPEIGYHINKKYWRRGFAKETARAVRDWTFTNTKYDKLYSYMKYTNVGSYSTALANGMRKVKEYPDPKNEISYAYAITRAEWEKLMRCAKDYVKDNEQVWDTKAANNEQWSAPVSAEVIAQARNGTWSIVLTPKKPVPRNWFPEDLSGKQVLCLAGGGGQQGPVLAAAGASVTVFDNSSGQLEKDRFVANRDGLAIRTVQGNMQDLSVFADESFDLIVHPWSNNYVDSVLPVWKECARILKNGGILLAGFGSPLEYIFDLEKFERGELELKHSIPYADIEHLDEPKVREVTAADGYCWGHSLEDQIQGQIAAGFVISGFYEDAGASLFNNYINTSMATKAVNCRCPAAPGLTPGGTC